MGGLSFSDRAARSMWRIVPKRAVSGAIGWGEAAGIPTRLRSLMLSRFARVYGIDVERGREAPRRLRAASTSSSRAGCGRACGPIDDEPGRVVSTADGTVVECGLRRAPAS